MYSVPYSTLYGRVQNYGLAHMLVDPFLLFLLYGNYGLVQNYGLSTRMPVVLNPTACCTG